MQTSTIFLQPSIKVRYTREQNCGPQEASCLLCNCVPAVTSSHYVVEWIGWVHNVVWVSEKKLLESLGNYYYYLKQCFKHLTSRRIWLKCYGVKHHTINQSWNISITRRRWIYIFKHINNELDIKGSQKN